MKTKINQLLFFLFVFSISYVSAQQIVVEGTVKSSEDNMPVPGVNVVVKGTTRGTSTDFDGNVYHFGCILENARIQLRRF